MNLTQETVLTFTVAAPPDTTRPIISSGNTITVESVEGAAVPAGDIYTATSMNKMQIAIHSKVGTGADLQIDEFVISLLTMPSAGSYSFDVKATDTAGNESDKENGLALQLQHLQIQLVP